MVSDMARKYELIREAILNKMQVTAIYQGLYREMCPYKLGTKNRRANALFGQFGGESKSGGVIAPRGNNASVWRCLHLDELEDVRIREGDWYGIPPLVGTGQPTCVGEVDVSVED